MTTANLQLLTHHHTLVATINKLHFPTHVKMGMMAIAEFFNLQHEKATPTRKQIANITGLSLSSITRNIALGVKTGILIRTAQYTHCEGESAPRQIANKYTFNFSLLGLSVSRKARKEKKKADQQRAAKQNRSQTEKNNDPHAYRERENSAFEKNYADIQENSNSQERNLDILSTLRDALYKPKRQ
jgi:hypothetical protein